MMETNSFVPGAGQPALTQWHGVYRGVVIVRSGSNVRAKIPQVLGNEVSNWAPPLVNTGLAPPAVGTLVAVAFMGGDINYPYYSPLTASTPATVTEPDGSVWSSTGLAMASGKFITTSDTWHSVAAGNSWTGNINYRLTAENETQFSASSLGTPASAVNGTIITLAAKYRPNSNITWQGGVGLVAGTWTLQTNGALVTAGFPASSTVTLGPIKIPLDL